MEDAPRLAAAERAERLRRLSERFGFRPDRRDPVRSLVIRGRRYDAWHTVEEVGAAVPLQTFGIFVEAGAARYERIDAGPPFLVIDLEKQPPERAAEQLAVHDFFAYDARQAALLPYRRRAAAAPGSPARLFELALMIWYHDFAGAPGGVAEAEPALLKAVELNPRAVAGHGLLGEVRLRLGRAREALPAFALAARLLPRHPRFHYCASVAHQLSGDPAAAKRELARARRVAGPKLRSRFTSASNPLEDYRYSLLCEAVRLRGKHEGLERLSMRELAERDRAENRIRRSKLPPFLRPLAPLAERWGIGDDGSRGYLLRRATRREREQLRRMHARHAQRISDWLDTQLPDRPTPETGAFLYLLEACEELL